MGIEQQKVQNGYRLINTKYPAISLFDDIASAEDFERLYAIQRLTNPRLKDEVGDVSLLDLDDIPYHCQRGRSYAIAPFTHINPNGGRFNDGLFGVLYVASDAHTAACEVKHHQQRYWKNIEGLAYDRIMFRVLSVAHTASPLHRVAANDTSILDPEDYTAAQQLARKLKKQQYQGIEYPSVRNQSGQCWALFTPKPVIDIVPSNLVEMIWNGEQISEINTVNNFMD